MAVSVLVPRLGMDMAGGMVAEWYAPDGSTVSAGEPVCRLECEYVAVDIEADGGGVLRHRSEAGSIQRPGNLLGLILGPGERMPVEPPPAEMETPGPSVRPHPEAAVAFAADVEPAELPEPVRFRSRTFDGGPQPHWEPAPGDEPDFESALFGDAPDAAASDDGGAPIAGLPLWEAPDLSTVPVKDVASPVDGLEIHGSDAEPSNVTHLPFAGQPFAAREPAWMRVTVAMTEAAKLREQLAREWSAGELRPANEDIVARAVARAVGDWSGAEGNVEVAVLGAEGRIEARVVGKASRRRFRDAVAARADGGDDLEPDCWLVSLAASGIDEGTPDLAIGQVAFAMGAERAGIGGPLLSLVLAYDRRMVDTGSAAQLLGRVRDLVEAPYALLAE